MKKNDLLKFKNQIVRILNVKEDQVFVIDCVNRTVPRWRSAEEFKDFAPCTREEFYSATNMKELDFGNLDESSKKFAHERYTLIAPILPFLEDDRERLRAVKLMVQRSTLSRQTIVKSLYSFLAYQDLAVLAPKKAVEARPFTEHEKNIRWALNKFFYNKNRNTLKFAYMLMLKERYCDDEGNLVEDYPTIHQFRYFYRKHKKIRKYYISRNGKTDYQRNRRPLLGDGVAEFAPHIGVGMLDSTICDIYLVNKEGKLIGRPVLTACVDAYSSLCCGYTLTLEGGIYSLKKLMQNVVCDKVALCRSHGIKIKAEDWNCTALPATLVTDMGREYVSKTFEQITDLGVTLVNLPPYRPDLKGIVENFFNLIQNLYKPHLKGKGVIEPDFQERGARDYRKDAVLTLEDFEKILLHCILYYNNSRILENFPYTRRMLTEEIKPTAGNIWNDGLQAQVVNLIFVTEKKLMLTLLPRTNGAFERKGLLVNRLRYKNKNYPERYLTGGEVQVAYNPDDVSKVWLIENGEYEEFTLIEKRFQGLDIGEVEGLKERQRKLVRESERENTQARIDLANHISVIADGTRYRAETVIKDIRENRQREQRKLRTDFFGGEANG